MRVTLIFLSPDRKAEKCGHGMATRTPPCVRHGAGLPEGHSHRLRDTFSVELLQKGVSIETVSLLLGHKSIRVTETHYAPWVKIRQDALEAAVPVMVSLF
jgi:integrase